MDPLKFLRGVKPEWFFIITAIVVEALLLAFIPPLQMPDEQNHFYRAYQVSEGHFLPEKNGNRLGGYLPASFAEFSDLFTKASGNEYYRVRREDILSSFHIAVRETDRQFMDFPNTSYYSPVSYMPQALGTFILRQFHASVGMLYYGGRVFAAIAWLLCTFFVIRILPFYKWLFTLLFLLPMNVYVANSSSADTVTNLLSFFLMASVLRHCAGLQLLRKHLVILLLLGILLALAKIIYAFLVILVIMIPAARFITPRRKYVFVAALFLFTFITAYAWSEGVVMKYQISYNDYDPLYRDIASVSIGADYKLQKEHLLAHPFFFFKVVYNTLVNSPGFYLRSYIGGFGTILHMFLPWWLVLLSFSCIIFTALTEPAGLVLSGLQKLLVLLAAAGTFLLFILSQQLTWNMVGSDEIGFLWGRYLTPIFPLLFLLFGNQRFQFSSTRPIAMVFILFLSSYGVYYLYTGFTKDYSYSTFNFYCDAENRDAKGAFIADDSTVKLGGTGIQSGYVHHTGRYSMALPPQGSGFTYVFKNLDHLDLVEAEVWQKGEGAVLTLSGHEDNEGDFYFSEKNAGYKSPNGWQKLHMVFSIWKPCKKPTAVFYIYNSGTDTIYVDDVTFRIKKFKTDVRKLMPG